MKVEQWLVKTRVEAITTTKWDCLFDHILPLISLIWVIAGGLSYTFVPSSTRGIKFPSTTPSGTSFSAIPKHIQNC